MSYNSTVPADAACLERDTRRPDAPFYHWLVLGYVFLFVLALSANLHVLFKLFHYSRRRFRDHILLLNLCAADLFVTLVYIPSEIYAFSVGRWHNDGICKAIAALKGLGIYVSSCTIIGISVDRYLSIVHPLTVYQSNTRNKLFVAGSWLVSAIACIPQLIIFERITDPVRCLEMCGDTLSSDPIKRVTYNIAVAIFAYIAPLITIFFSYFRILYVLQKRCDRRGFRFAKAHGRSVQSCDKHPSSEPLNANGAKSSRTGQAPVDGEINTHNMKTVTRAKLQTLKLTALIVICFILCWTPYYCIVFFLLITDPATGPDERPSPHSNVTLTTPLDTNISHEPSRDERSLLILLMLAVSNSVLDPMIYGYYLMRPMKSSCWSRMQARMGRGTSRRAMAAAAATAVASPVGILSGDKESRMTASRAINKHGNPDQHENAIECQL